MPSIASAGVVAEKNAAGEKLSSVRVTNDQWLIAAAVAEAAEPEAAIRTSGPERPSLLWRGRVRRDIGVVIW